MDSLRTIVKEVFKETLYESEVVMRSDRAKNLTIVTDNLRGVCGITVITVIEPAKPVSETVEVTRLKVKFFLSTPSIKEHLFKMATEARKIDGVFSFIPKNAKKVQSRIYK